MHLAYSVLLCAYFLAVLPALVYRRVRHGKAVGRIRDRLGWLPEELNPNGAPSIWVHAVSVGEVMAVRPLLHDLRDTYPTHRVFLSTTTATGQHVARQLGAAVDGVFYAPLDLPPFIGRALDRVAPELMVTVDTEIWPNWLRMCRRRGVRTVIVNGRISDRSYRRYRVAKGFMRRALRDLDRVCAQTVGWGQRFVELGLPADRLCVCGSLKFDAPDPPSAGAAAAANDSLLEAFAFVGDRAVWVAASTLTGEDEPVLGAFAELRRTAGDALLILAPRHPERAASVLSLARARGFRSIARSELAATPLDPLDVDVVVLDTVGELARLFPLAALVFVGGSLVPAGGHNILEPAVCARAIVFGPHMQNFAEIAELFIRGGAAVQVATADDLPAVVVALFRDPVRRAELGAAARRLIEENRGARARTLEVLVELLPAAAGSGRPEAPAARAVP